MQQVYPNGRMSQAMDHLKIGDKLQFKGPRGSFALELNERRAIGEAVLLPHQEDLSLRTQEELLVSPSVSAVQCARQQIWTATGPLYWATKYHDLSMFLQA